MAVAMLRLCTVCWKAMPLLCQNRQKALLCIKAGCREHRGTVYGDSGFALEHAFMCIPTCSPSLGCCPAGWLGESQLPPTTVRARNHLSPPARGRLVGFLLSYQTISFLNFLLDFPRIILKSKFSFPHQERMFISVLQSQGLFKSLPPTLKYTRG